jgi:hypothetical protein
MGADSYFPRTSLRISSCVFDVGNLVTRKEIAGCDWERIECSIRIHAFGAIGEATDMKTAGNISFQEARVDEG